MSKPSPAQARLLRALAHHEYVRILWNGSGAKLIGPDHWKMSDLLERDGIQLRSPTVRVLVQNGWLEQDAESANAYRLSPEGLDILEELDESDFETPVLAFTALQIHDALRRSYYGDLWAYFREVSLSDWQTERRADALAFRITAPHELHAIEVKVDRSDFLRELDDSTKRLPAQQLAHCFYFAAPAGLIQDHELPFGCGLIEVHSSKSVVESVEAQYSRAEPPTWSLLAAMMRARERVVV